MAATPPSSLIVRPICAKLTHDTDTFGQMDPYCVVNFGAQHQRTHTATDAGKFPNWNEQFMFRRTGEDLLQILVYDQDNASADDMVGEATFPVSRLGGQTHFEDWLPLTFKGRAAGEIRIGIQIMVEESAAKAPSAAPPAGYPAYPGYPHSKQPIQATRLLGRIHLLWLIRLLGMQRLILERRQGTQLLLQAILRRATRLIHSKLLLAILRRATRPTRPKLLLDILLHRATQLTHPKLLLDILLRRAIHLRKATASPILDNSFWVLLACTANTSSRPLHTSITYFSCSIHRSLKLFSVTPMSCTVRRTSRFLAAMRAATSSRSLLCMGLRLSMSKSLSSWVSPWLDRDLRTSGTDCTGRLIIGNCTVFMKM